MKGGDGTTGNADSGRADAKDGRAELPSAATPAPKRRLGRPTSKQSGEIEAKILLVAKQLFLSNGYEATSMEAIAQTAGVSKRTLYARHSTKEELMEAVVKDRVRKWSDEAAAHNPDSPIAFRDRLIGHAKTLMHSLGDPEIQQFDRLILQTAQRFPNIAQTFYQLGYRYELQFLTDEIARSTRHDASPAARPERVARQLFSMIQGWRRTEETIRTIDPAEADEFAADAVDVLFRGRENW